LDAGKRPREYKSNHRIWGENETSSIAAFLSLMGQHNPDLSNKSNLLLA
jgi:hypothetical protein